MKKLLFMFCISVFLFSCAEEDPCDFQANTPDNPECYCNHLDCQNGGVVAVAVRSTGFVYADSCHCNCPTGWSGPLCSVAGTGGSGGGTGGSGGGTGGSGGGTGGSGGGTGGSCTGIANWEAYPTVYTVGDQVVYQGILYEAQTGPIWITPGDGEHWWKTIKNCN